MVKAIPDLKITVTCWLFDPTTKSFKEDTINASQDQSKPPVPPRNPVLRLTKMDDFTVLCLLDCLPEEIAEIKIAQPPHQQRYSMGESLKVHPDGTITAELLVRMLYTSKADAPEGTGEHGEWKLLPKTGPDDPLPDEQPKEADQKSFYNSETRCIDPIAIAKVVNQTLVDSKTYPKMYTDAVPNASMLGMELSDPACKWFTHALTSYIFIIANHNRRSNHSPTQSHTAPTPKQRNLGPTYRAQPLSHVHPPTLDRAHA